MLVIKRNKLFLKIAEVYFSTQHEVNIPDVDVVMYIQSLKNRGNCKEFKTLHIDLSEDEGVLFSNFRKNARYEIKRAETKDNLNFFSTNNPTTQEINNFAFFYDKFAQAKRVSICNVSKLNALARTNALHISGVMDDQTRGLCYHAYINDGIRARLLYSASHHLNEKDSSLRSLIGRANRHLHWVDMKSFKENGISIYDFGGLALNEVDISLKGINDFKRSFGGREIIEYNSFESKTILGKFALLYSRRVSLTV